MNLASAPVTNPVANPVSSPGRPRPVTPLGIAEARLTEVLDLLDHPADQAAGVVDPRVRDGVAAALALVGGLDPYLLANAGPESGALRALADRTAAHDWQLHRTSRHGSGGPAPLEQEMLSGHVEGQFLRLLARAVRARTVLEIGMFTGYSALALAEALPADGRVVACEIDPVAAGIALECFAASPAGARIDIRTGPAMDSLGDLATAGECFDLVFVDADKSGYLDYLHAILDNGLLAHGGLVCVDNTLMQGHPWTGDRSPNGDAVATFNRAVAADQRLEQVIVPLRDGLTLLRRADDEI